MEASRRGHLKFTHIMAGLIGIGVVSYYVLKTDEPPSLPQVWVPPQKEDTIRAAPKPARKSQQTEGTAADEGDAPSTRASELSDIPPPGSLVPAADLQLMQNIKLRYVTGDFLGALELAEKAMTENHGPQMQTWLKEQHGVLLTSAGWAKLRLGDCAGAVKLMKAALDYQRTMEITKGLAYCQYKLKNLYAAEEEFDLYLKGQPGDPQMLVLYADLLESSGRFEQAVQALEKASAAEGVTQADQEAIASRLAAMRKRAKESEFQLYETSNNFRLTYRAEDSAELIEFVLQELETALDYLADRFGFDYPRQTIEVILYPGDVFSSVVSGGPAWAEGIFDGRMRIPLRDYMLQQPGYGHLPMILRHELVHALFAQMADNRDLPPWLNEGFAQRFSCPDPCRFEFGPNPGGFLATGDFHNAFVSYNKVKAGRAYQQSMYLSLLLEKEFGRDSYRAIVRRVKPAADLSSDALLRGVPTTFAEIHRRATRLWERGETF